MSDSVQCHHQLGTDSKACCLQIAILAEAIRNSIGDLGRARRAGRWVVLSSEGASLPTSLFLIMAQDSGVLIASRIVAPSLRYRASHEITHLDAMGRKAGVELMRSPATNARSAVGADDGGWQRRGNVFSAQVKKMLPKRWLRRIEERLARDQSISRRLHCGISLLASPKLRKLHADAISTISPSFLGRNRRSPASCVDRNLSCGGPRQVSDSDAKLLVAGFVKIRTHLNERPKSDDLSYGLVGRVDLRKRHNCWIDNMFKEVSC